MKGYCLINSPLLRRHLHTYFETANIDHVFIDVEDIFEINFRKRLPDFIVLEKDANIVEAEKLNRLMKSLFSNPIDVILLSISCKEMFSMIEEGYYEIDISKGERLSQGFEMYLAIKTLHVQEKITLENTIRSLRRVLFVDDSHLQQKQVELIFQNTGYHVAFASNGIEALKAIEREMPSLVITDLQMPMMDGYTLCQTIREKYRELTIPIIVTTSSLEESTLEKTYQMGADDFIAKPLTEDKLINKVNQYFNQRKRYEKILIVEDSLLVQSVLKLGIARRGYTVYMADNGERGLEIALREKPDVILTDINMPVMDGYEMIRRIRKFPEIEKTPCIIMSSSDGKYNQKLAQSLGVEKILRQALSN